MKILIFLIFGVSLVNCGSSLISKNSKTKSSELIETSQQETVDCEKCNIDLVKGIRLNIDSLTEEKILEFLTCFNETCFNNVEFGQAANYSLFILLQESSSNAISVLENNKQLDIDYIKFTLENPISDDIDINKVIESVEAVDINLEVKKELKKSLKIAIEKYK